MTIIPTRDIPTPILDILALATVEGNVVTLNSGQLDRADYVAVNRVLESLGGKWNRFVFGLQTRKMIELNPTNERLRRCANSPERDTERLELSMPSDSTPTPESVISPAKRARSTAVNVGDQFGRWTVVARQGTKSNEAAWLCKCECGGQKVVRTSHLTSGGSSSCGCYRREDSRRRAIVHGLRQKPEYIVWQGMRQRCLSPNHQAYPRYGGRGIKICDAWNDFETFLRDMGARPTPAHTIDRIDNDGPYSPENCRWVLTAEQNANRSISRSYTHRGRTMTLQQWADEVGITYGRLWKRLKEGMPVDDLLGR